MRTVDKDVIGSDARGPDGFLTGLKATCPFCGKVCFAAYSSREPGKNDHKGMLLVWRIADDDREAQDWCDHAVEIYRDYDGPNARPRGFGWDLAYRFRGMEPETADLINRQFEGTAVTCDMCGRRLKPADRKGDHLRRHFVNGAVPEDAARFILPA
jgi:hypothetical protein